MTIERNPIQRNVALWGANDPKFSSQGGGIYFSGPFAAIRDNAIYGNVAALLDERGRGGGMFLHDANEVPGPAALLPDYHLSPGSNAIDHALPLAWVTRDIDGDSRLFDLAPDVGADEYVRARIYLPLVLRNF